MVRTYAHIYIYTPDCACSCCAHIYGTCTRATGHTDDLPAHAADGSLAPAQTNLFVMTNPKQRFTMNQVMTSPQKKGKGARKVKTPMDIAKMKGSLL